VSLLRRGDTLCCSCAFGECFNVNLLVYGGSIGMRCAKRGLFPRTLMRDEGVTRVQKGAYFLGR
jgi:hypothetical protein